MTTITEEGAAKATNQPKAARKGPVAPRRAHGAPKEVKAGTKAPTRRKGAQPKKSAKKAKVAEKPESTGREGSKTAQILELLKRPGGVGAKELLKATGWLPHSLRGFLSGTVRKKMGLTVVSAKAADGERTYSIEA